MIQILLINTKSLYYFFKMNLKTNQKLLLIFFCLTLAFNTNAQTKKDTIQWLMTFQQSFANAGKKLQERDLDSALFFAGRSKNFIEEHFGKKTYGLYAQTIFFTSVIYQVAHNYESAMAATKEFLQITVDNKGKNNDDYLRGLMALANLYFVMYDYAKAEETVKEGIQLCITLKGKETREYIRLLKIYSEINAAIQNESESKRQAKEALIIETKLAENNPDEKLNLLSDLARIYKDENDIKKADSLYNIILNTIEKQEGSESHSYAMALGNLGALYKEFEDLEKAKEFYLKAAAILKNNKNTQLDYASMALDLGDIYLRQKAYSTAENYYLQAVKITEQIAGKVTLDYQVALTDLQRFYGKTGNIEKSILYTTIQIENWRQRWIKAFTTFTEDEKENSLQAEIGNMDYAFSVLYDSDPARSKDLVPVLFNVNNDIDGLLLQNNSTITQFVKAKKDSALSALYNSWINYKKQYSQALQLSSDDKQAILNELETKIQLQEKQLLRYDPQLEKYLRIDPLSYKEIAAKLKPGEALIKWINFTYHNRRNFTDSIFYGAFIVLPKKPEPIFIKVCEQKSLKELLKIYYNAGDRGAGEDDAKPVNRDSLHFYLYDLLWKPLLPYLAITKTIYIVPSGQIHRISFAALQNENGKSLFDIYGLHQLLSSREILNNPIVNKNRSALVFGGVDFSNEEQGAIKNNIKDTVQKKFIAVNTSRGGSFNALPGTLHEVNAIQNILSGNKWNVQLFTGKSASKINFTENISGNFSILHLATHGFYFPQKQNSIDATGTFNEKIRSADKPLLRSGIVFSGVNKYWSNNTMKQTNNNGIVTAQEIANLDLSKNDLVVLSACETALGDINSTEGVYGLQRGFKMAGANKMIMSLWPVPDKETSELMQNFYANVAKGQSFYNAFYNARSIIKQKYKDPYKWAGFVLIGE
jgi:CHAT domain-containing protein